MTAPTKTKYHNIRDWAAARALVCEDCEHAAHVGRCTATDYIGAGDGRIGMWPVRCSCVQLSKAAKQSVATAVAEMAEREGWT